MTPREYLISKEIATDSQVCEMGYHTYHNLTDILAEYARIQTKELEELLDKQIDNFLTPEKRQEILDIIKNESNTKTKE